jgi:hypothetical protein
MVSLSREFQVGPPPWEEVCGGPVVDRFLGSVEQTAFTGRGDDLVNRLEIDVQAGGPVGDIPGQTGAILVAVHLAQLLGADVRQSADEVLLGGVTGFFIVAVQVRGGGILLGGQALLLLGGGLFRRLVFRLVLDGGLLVLGWRGLLAGGGCGHAGQGGVGCGILFQGCGQFRDLGFKAHGCSSWRCVGTAILPLGEHRPLCEIKTTEKLTFLLWMFSDTVAGLNPTF